jgi:hypothetical protein
MRLERNGSLYNFALHSLRFHIGDDDGSEGASVTPVTFWYMMFIILYNNTLKSSNKIDEYNIKITYYAIHRRCSTHDS